MAAALLNPRPRLTPRLTLRPFRRRDVNGLHEAVLASLPALRPWLPWAHGDYSKTTAQHFIRDSLAAWNEGKAFDFSIRRTEAPNRHLGNVSVWFTSRPNLVGEVGYWVRTEDIGTGIATEATARVLGVAFDELGMHRVTLRIAVGNHGSERIAHKLGFLLEGTLRGDVKVGDEWVDHTAWGLLRTEWEVERERYQAEAWT